MKSINYLAHVVKTYRKLIDDINNGCQEDINSYIREIEESGNRQTTDAWLKGYTNNLDLIYTFSNTPLQNYLGMILEYDKDTCYALVDTKNNIRVGDEIELLSYDNGIRKFVVTSLLDPKNEEVEIANNTFFKYKVKIPFEVKKYEILRKPINK
jgi:putative protease